MKKIWYAVMRDAEDNDWGYGSHNKREAAKMVRKLRREGHPDAFIEIVEMSDGDAVSVGKIHDVRGL
jgi:hypothetical protein